jgi:hypothetical protein
MIKAANTSTSSRPGMLAVTTAALLGAVSFGSRGSAAAGESQGSEALILCTECHRTQAELHHWHTTKVNQMQQVTASITPLPGARQPFPGCPFYPPLGNIPLIRLPGRRFTTKYAPSVAMLTGEAGTNPVLPRIQGWGIPVQAPMPGIAYDLQGTNPNHGAIHG